MSTHTCTYVGIIDITDYMESCSITTSAEKKNRLVCNFPQEYFLTIGKGEGEVKKQGKTKLFSLQGFP